MDKASLFAALESEVHDIEVKALGLVLRFKALTGTARDAFNAAITAGDKSNSHFEASLIAATVVDADGAPMFEAGDIEVLRQKNATALSAIAQEAMKVNKLGVDAEKEAQGN